LRILEEKGHIRHEQDGPRYVYMPTVARDSAKRSALRHLVQTFFEGSTSQAISALLDSSSSKLNDAELERLTRLLEAARKRGV
jgi:predicted transcriptional regulator